MKTNKITKIEYFDREGTPVCIITYNDDLKELYFGHSNGPYTEHVNSYLDEPISKEEFDEISVNDYEKERTSRLIREKKNPTKEELELADKLERERRKWRKEKSDKEWEKFLQTQNKEQR